MQNGYSIKTTNKQKIAVTTPSTSKMAKD